MAGFIGSLFFLWGLNFVKNVFMYLCTGQSYDERNPE